MLFSMPDIAGLELQVVDVAGDDNLLEAYGEQVPVLQLLTITPTQSTSTAPTVALELAWPFSPQSIADALHGL